MPSVPNQSHMISPYIFNPSTFVTGATIPFHHVPPATSRMTQLTVRKEAHNARQPVRQLSLRGTHIEGWIQWHLQLLKVNMCSIDIIQDNDFFTSTGCYSPKEEGLRECIWENILKQWAGSNQPTVPSPFSIERFFFLQSSGSRWNEGLRELTPVLGDSSLTSNGGTPNKKTRIWLFCSPVQIS